MEKEKQKITVEEFTKFIQDSVKEKYNLDVNPLKVKGLAFFTLKDHDLLTEEDKYKTYDHVGELKEIFDGVFPDAVEWEDIEQFTGNLYYIMRLATKKPITEINELIDKYQKNETLESSLVINDLVFLIENVKLNINNTWRYIENTQKKGVPIIINKILKWILKNKEDGKQN